MTKRALVFLLMGLVYFVTSNRRDKIPVLLCATARTVPSVARTVPSVAVPSVASGKWVSTNPVIKIAGWYKHALMFLLML